MRRLASASTAPFSHGRRPNPGRLRRYLLLALATAFMLVPVASASALDVHVKIDGDGAGSLVPVTGDEPLAGTPPINCSYVSPGPTTGTCDSTAFEFEPGLFVFKIKQVTAPGSEFGGWTVEEGLTFAPCEIDQAECGVGAFGGEIKLKATFNKAPITDPSLTVGATGSGSGDVECKVDGGSAEPCDPTYPEGTEIELAPVADSGSEFVQYENGSGDAASCTGETTCAFTLNQNSGVEAAFEPILHSLDVNIDGLGSGAVECEADGGLAETCAAEYAQSTELTLVPGADPGSEFTGFSNGTGSASSCTGTSPCSFTMEADSEVDADFDPIENAATLTLIKGGNLAGGTVISTPAGINCGPACEVESALFSEGDEVELVATPAAGYVFAGSDRLQIQRPGHL